MSTIREQIILAVEASLNVATGKPAGLTVHRNRTWPIESDTLPAIMIATNEDSAPKSVTAQKFGPQVIDTVEVTLEARAEGSPPDAALDPLILWAHLRMFADEKFGHLANGVIRGRTVWTSKAGSDKPLAAAAMHFFIEYRTTRVDPSRSN